jgi:hypothetical protein
VSEIKEEYDSFWSWESLVDERSSLDGCHAGYGLTVMVSSKKDMECWEDCDKED